MKHFTKLFIAFCLFGIGTSIQAQNSLSTTAGNAGAVYTVNFTVGQVFNATLGTTQTINQGIQGPYEISVLTGKTVISELIPEASVFPNPTTGFLILKIEENNIDDLDIQIIDMNGGLFFTGKVKGKETPIQMGNIKSGTYLLKISNKNKEIKTFKIIKK